MNRLYYARFEQSSKLEVKNVVTNSNPSPLFSSLTYFYNPVMFKTLSIKSFYEKEKTSHSQKGKKSHQKEDSWDSKGEKE